MNLRSCWKMCWSAGVCITLAATMGCGGSGAGGAVGADILFWAVTSLGQLVKFNASDPATFTNSLAITGLNGTESVVAMDFRVADDLLYVVTDEGNLYTLNTSTGVVTLVSGSFAALIGTQFGMSISPVTDTIRLVSDGDENLRVDPDDGALTTDTALAYDGADPNTGADPNVVGATYRNNILGAGNTFLYGIDSNLDVLVRINPENGGILTTFGGLGVDTGNRVAMDIMTTDSFGYASLDIGGFSRLYRINLINGTATDLGAIGTSVNIVTMAAAP